MVELTPEEAESLAKFLGSITEHTELEALALITKEGVRLAFSCIPDYNIDPDLFSSLNAIVIKNSYEAVKNLGYNDLLEVVLRGKDAFIILSSAGKFFIMGACRQLKDLAKVVSVFRYYAKEIGKRYPDLEEAS
ncbi:MAG: roadblock/LC7 domain-containing protein [Promethearchaeota archaeon]